MKHITTLKFSQVFFWLFLVSLPFNKRVIYNPEHAYISGFFSYYLAYFLYLSDIFLVLTLVSWLVESRFHFTIREWYKSPTFWLGLAIISPLFHVQHNYWEIYSMIKALELITLGIFVSQNLQSIKTRVIAWITFLSGIGQALLGIWQFHVQHMAGLGLFGEYISNLGTGGLATLDTIHGKIIRGYGTFPHPNVFAAYLVLALILGYLLLVSRETGQKAQFLIAIGEYLLVLGIFISFSRVAWAACAVSSFLFLWYASRSRKWLKLAIIPLIVSCATILLLWHGLILGRITNIEGTNSYTSRLEFNHAGLEIWKNNLPFGVGIGNYIPTMEKVFHVQPWQYQPSHNIFIYLGASLGLIGLGIFLWLLVSVFRCTWNAPRTPLRFSLLVIALVFLFMSNFDHFLVTIQQGQLMLALILGLMAGISKLKETNA